MAKVYIGTSGWMYPHWKGEFYPENLPQKDWLRYYSNEYDTVEVNSSFYRQTKASTFAKWLTETLPAQAGPKISSLASRAIDLLLTQKG